MWHTNPNNVIALARHLIREGELSSPEMVVSYFENPVPYGEEWAKYEASLALLEFWSREAQRFAHRGFGRC